MKRALRANPILVWVTVDSIVGMVRMTAELADFLPESALRIYVLRGF